MLVFAEQRFAKIGKNINIKRTEPNVGVGSVLKLELGSLQGLYDTWMHSPELHKCIVMNNVMKR